MKTKTHRTPRTPPTPPGMQELLDAARPMLDKWIEQQSSQETRRLETFRQAFAAAENSKQRTALAVAYLGK
jgi:hypothetical protein